MASGALGLLPIGRGDGGEAADCVGGLSRPSMAFEALGLLPGVTLSPTPPPSRGRGLKGMLLKRLVVVLRKAQPGLALQPL
jgi:hypothetical protein